MSFEMGDIMKFKGKKAIVTGANRSIGQEIAVALAEQGADVVISYRSDEAGAKATIQKIKKHGRDATCFCADFSKSENIAIFVQNAIAFLGQVDILVNNAAMLSRELFFEVTPETMARVFQVNTVAPFYTLQLCAKNMVDNHIKGSIVNISSIAGSTTFPRGIAYASSKAAVNKFTQNSALELGQYGIRVNTISPGVVASGMNEETAQLNPQLWKEYHNKIPLMRTGTPADISNSALFLLSNDANWITGKIFEIDGGHVL